jgi:hypothetical protein
MIARLKKARDLGIPDEMVEKILGEISESMKHKAFCDRRYKKCKELLKKYEKDENADVFDEEEFVDEQSQEVQQEA